MVMCFAWGCSATESDTCKKSFFKFPKDPSLRKKWICAVNRTKEDIEKSKSPRLCEDHFSEDSFDKIPSLARELRYRVHLKKDAIPDRNRFKRKFTTDSASNPEKRPRQSLAFQKRQNLEVGSMHYNNSKKTSDYIYNFKVNSCTLGILHYMRLDINLNAYCKMRNTLIKDKS